MKKEYLAIVSVVIALTGCGSGESDSEYNNSNIEKNSKLKSLSSQTNVSQNIQARKLSRSLSRSNIPIAWGFDYPIGNRGYDSNGNKVPIDEHISSERNEQYNLGKNVEANNSRSGTLFTTGWWNYSDVGNFYKHGLHPGEDWNYGSRGMDAGKPIFAIANGKIIELKPLYSSASSGGWEIVLEHVLPDGSKIYSIYLHVTSDQEEDGSLVYDKKEFTYQKGDIVLKGAMIARCATGMTLFPEHLHFEIRNKLNINDIYPNDDGRGYYTHDKKQHKDGLSKSQVLEAFKIMKDEGILDPSDFIDDHRDIYPWIGNGSIISYHGENHNPNYNDTEYPYGITQDITRTHSQLNNLPNLFKQSGFFQWQISSNCKNLKINHSGINDNVDITIGNWNNRTNDITFKNVRLPFILGKNNLGRELFDGSWRVIAVTFNKSTVNTSSSNDIYNTLSATCTDEPSTPLNSSTSSKMLRNQYIMIGEHQWNGNGSIISRIFKDSEKYSGSDDWPYGVFQDVTMVHKNQYKPVVFFQWMSSDVCNALEIDADLPNEEKHVTLGIKNWASNTYENKKVTLPYTIQKESLWSVIQVAFDKPVSKDARVNAICKY